MKWTQFLIMTLVFGAFLFGGLYITHKKPSTVVQQIPEPASVISVKEVFDLTNKARQENGLPVLVEAPQLDESAKEKCTDMAQNDYWAHDDPSGKSVWYSFIWNNYHYKKAGENLARGQRSSEEVVNGWMNSKLHRDNILDSAFNKVGYATCPFENQTLTVQHFAK